MMRRLGVVLACLACLLVASIDDFGPPESSAGGGVETPRSAPASPRDARSFLRPAGTTDLREGFQPLADLRVAVAGVDRELAVLEERLRCARHTRELRMAIGRGE